VNAFIVSIDNHLSALLIVKIVTFSSGFVFLQLCSCILELIKYGIYTVHYDRLISDSIVLLNLET